MAYASAKQPQSPGLVCWVHVRLYLTRARLPANTRTAACVSLEAPPARESYTVTNFAAPNTVSQCRRTGENRTYSTCTQLMKMDKKLNPAKLGTQNQAQNSTKSSQKKQKYMPITYLTDYL